MSALLAAWWLLPARLRGNWRLLLVAGVGVLAASSLLAAAPIYTSAMSALGLQYRLATALGDDRLQSVTLEGLLTTPRDDARRTALDEVLEARLGWLGAGLVRADRSDRLEARLGGGSPAPAPDWAAYVHALGDLEALVSVVEGRLPQPGGPRPEAVLFAGFERHVALGSTVSLRAGGFDDCQRRPVSEDPDEARAEVQCRPTTRATPGLDVTVVGFVRPLDVDHPAWALAGAALEVPERPLYATGPGVSPRDRAEAAAGVGSLPLLVPAEALAGVFATSAPTLTWRHRAGFLVEPSRVGLTEVTRALSEYEALRTDLEDRLDVGPAYTLPVVTALAQFEGSRSFNQVPLLIMLLQIAGIALYYLVIVAQVMVDRESEELGVLGSRGASAGQVSVVHAIEACIVAVPAAAIAPLVAAGGVGLLGWTPAFESLSGGRLLAASAPPLAYLLSAGAGLLAIVAMILPVALGSDRTIMAIERSGARPATRSFLQRYYIDVGVVVLAGLLLWELQRRGTVFSADAVGGWASDPLLLAAPFVTALAAAALLLRFYPPLLRVSAAVFGLGRSAALAIGLRRAARAPAAYARVLLLIVLALAVGTFAASYGPTVQASREDRTRYEAGADLRLSLSSITAGDVDALAAKVGAVEGVAEAVLATRTVLTTSGGTSLATLGVEAERVAGAAWFREDFAAEPLAALARRLQSAVPPGGGIELPANATGIEVSAFSEGTRSFSVIWARVRDATGRYANVDMGGSAVEGWATLEARFPEDLVPPLHFSGLLITDARGVGVQRQGSYYFDDVRVLVSGGAPQLIDDFEARLGWVHFADQRSAERLERSEERARSGTHSLRWQWTPGAPDGRRLLAINPGNVPLSAVASESALAGLGVTVGETVTLHLNGVRVPLTVRAQAALFPTLDAEPGFVVVNRRDLEALAQLLESPTARGPGELWVRLDAGDAGDAAGDDDGRVAVTEAIRAVVGSAAVDGAGRDAGTAIEETRADPTLQASGSGILGGAFAAVLALSLLGFVVAVTARERARLIEVAVLRAVGLSRGELLRSLLVEWGTVVVAGVALGIVLGRRVAGVMMAFLDVTETGTRAVPPFIVQTSWAAVGLGALLLVVGVGVGTVLVWRTSMRAADAAQLRLTR